MLTISNKRKLLAVFLSVMFLIAGIPVSPAQAAGTISVEVIASKSAVNVKEEVTFTIQMNNLSGADLLGFAFDLSIPDGMNYKPGSGTIASEFKTTVGWQDVEWDDTWTPDPDNGWGPGGTWPVVNFDEPNSNMTEYRVSGFGEEYSGTGTVDIATFVCTADTIGSKEVTLKNVGFYDTDVELIAAQVTPATINVSGSGSGSGSIVSGTVKSYNPGASTRIELIKGGTPQYTYTIPVAAGSGQVTQSFSISDVDADAYTLKVTKGGHLSYTKTTLVVGGSDVNFGEITLITGDINGDGSISAVDLGILLGDFNKSGSYLSDLNGDGSVSAIDLGLLLGNFNQSAVIE